MAANIVFIFSLRVGTAVGGVSRTNDTRKQTWLGNRTGSSHHGQAFVSAAPRDTQQTTGTSKKGSKGFSPWVGRLFCRRPLDGTSGPRGGDSLRGKQNRYLSLWAGFSVRGISKDKVHSETEEGDFAMPSCRRHLEGHTAVLFSPSAAPQGDSHQRR